MNYKSLLIAMVFAALPVFATTVTFNLANPAGDVGSYNHTYTSSPAGFTITAYGYTNDNPNHLYGKTGSGDEYGLGLTGTSDFEISSNDAVILDVSQLASFQSMELEIGSVQPGETYDVLGGDSLNSVTTQLITGGTVDNVYFSVPHFSNYKYLAVTAPYGDVLINSVRADNNAVPEPATFGIAGVALLGVFFVRRRAARV